VTLNSTPITDQPSGAPSYWQPESRYIVVLRIGFAPLDARETFDDRRIPQSAVLSSLIEEGLRMVFKDAAYKLQRGSRDPELMRCDEPPVGATMRPFG
jgi:hypothetical protein